MHLRIKNREGINILNLTVGYAVLTAIAVFTAVFLANSSIYASPSEEAKSVTETTDVNNTSRVGSNVSGYSSNTNKNQAVEPVISGIPKDETFLSFSDDGQYCIYLSNGTLNVIAISTGKIIKQISEKDAITYAVMMHDRNRVIYFTKGNNTNGTGSNSEISINTYNLDTGIKTVQYSLKAGKNASIKGADYSSLTGHVSFDINSGNTDVIYYINMMKRLVRIPIGGTVEAMALTNNRQSIYYDKGGILYYQSKPVGSLKNIKTKLLGCDLNDYVYAQSLSDRTLIYVIKGTSVIKNIELDDPGFTNVYSNKTDIYLAYPGYLLNLSADRPEKKTFGNEYSFEGLAGGRLFLSDKNGDIISKTIN